MPTDIRNTDDLIDSRDVIARIEELESERDSFVIGHPNGEEEPAPDQWAEENPDEAEELDTLYALAKQGEDYAPDWSYGETMIHDDYFEAYAEQLAEDIGAIDRDAKWPLTHIDWTAAADDLKQDYTSIDFDGQTYWIR